VAARQLAAERVCLPAQILWLKTGINVLFSFGRAAEPTDTLYNWHVWMSILLSASVRLSLTGSQP
jgi:hypothetical protein